VATFEPHQYAQGVFAVIINGQIASRWQDDDRTTGPHPVWSGASSLNVKYSFGDCLIGNAARYAAEIGARMTMSATIRPTVLLLVFMPLITIGARAMRRMS
jgi:hypothetical protein